MSKDLSQSDLILAGRFVDGDLPAHENAAAELRCGSDSEFAAAVEQIRSQSNLLKRLPKFQPADDLADRTLQASMDQVKAIMGAWPVESEVEETAPAANVAGKAFEWKSTVALIASLAGVVMVGAMLWQNNQGSESNIAMSEPKTSSVADADTAAMRKQSVDFAAERDDSFLQSIAENEAPKTAAPLSKGSTSYAESLPGDMATRNQTPDVALSGTPMKQGPQQSSVNSDLAIGQCATVGQIWCVNQDSSVAKSKVSDILQSNRIEVKREPQQNILPPSPDAVEAFYVAATPKQMKLAMSQIANNADIEMIQLPGSTDSPIADAIQQQFVQGNFQTQETSEESADATDLPPSFEAPSQALAQHLLTNALPRSTPRTGTPLGPVPPILKSGSPIDGLGQASRGMADLAMKSEVRPVAPPAPNKKDSNASDAGAGFGGRADNVEVAPSTAAAGIPAQTAARQPVAIPKSQQAELDKFLDDSDQQLRQYLILVRGGEAKR
ncbi:hypothetical protein [Mariniblastus fucicola]|uniref:Uncharacterized protein n=1 Tax=Mariniblastus fucicola TaxID=980251 RepID=A0A5B9PGB0_9BACT|nr:hypothetical protein [Mariniblastus fucicola]QEG24639.1 hypothetical protein MFFC18_45600 [Mariniblastus fucicola]